MYHVWARGNNRRSIYRDDEDRVVYLRLLGGVVVANRWRCFAYCLMDNHLHLVVETPGPNLGTGMRALHSLYASHFNERHGCCGHVFQGRFGSRVIVSDEQLWHTLAYVVRNPVEAGLCAAPDEWPWSSHVAMANGGAPAWLDVAGALGSLAGLGGDPRRHYLELTTAGAAPPRPIVH